VVLIECYKWKSDPIVKKCGPSCLQNVLRVVRKARDVGLQRTNLVDGETKQTVRGVNDELEHGSYLYWKGMVE
jgi:hypothetical protein